MKRFFKKRLRGSVSIELMMISITTILVFIGLIGLMLISFVQADSTTEVASEIWCDNLEGTIPGYIKHPELLKNAQNADDLKPALEDTLRAVKALAVRRQSNRRGVNDLYDREKMLFRFPSIRRYSFSVKDYRNLILRLENVK